MMTLWWVFGEWRVTATMSGVIWSTNIWIEKNIYTYKIQFSSNTQLLNSINWITEKITKIDDTRNLIPTKKICSSAKLKSRENFFPYGIYIKRYRYEKHTWMLYEYNKYEFSWFLEIWRRFVLDQTKTSRMYYSKKDIETGNYYFIKSFSFHFCMNFIQRFTCIYQTITNKNISILLLIIPTFVQTILINHVDLWKSFQ